MIMSVLPRKNKSQYLNYVIFMLLSMVLITGINCKDNTEISEPTQQSTYQFVSDQSNVIQSGGFAGINKTYPIEGQFSISINTDDNTASFEQVDANMVSTDGSLQNDSLAELFNMTNLDGTMTDANTIVFKGKATEPQPNPSDILITFVLNDDSVQMTGATTPPANSADYFIFSLKASARKIDN